MAARIIPCEDRLLTGGCPISRAFVAREVGILTHANANAAQGIQSLSLSRFPPDVVRRLYFEYRHLDADRGPGLADLSAEPFGIPAGAGPVSWRVSHLPVLADRRRGGRPHRAAEDSADVAVRADGQRRHP